MMLAFEIERRLSVSLALFAMLPVGQRSDPFLYSGEPTLEYWVQFWDSQFKTDTGMLERVHQRAAKLIKGLEHLPSLRVPGAFQAGDKRSCGGESYQYVSNWSEGAKEMESDTI